MKYATKNRIKFLKIIIAGLTQEEVKIDFDAWFNNLDPSKPQNADKIKEVTPTDRYYQPFSKRPRGSPIPVCIVESTTAKPSKNWMYSENAFVFKFADFAGQIYNSKSERLDYCKYLLKKYTYFSSKHYYLEEISYDNIDHKIPNSQYSSCFAVFALEEE